MNDITIIGISTITSTEAALTQHTIGKLWNEFLQTPIKDKLGEVSSSSIYAVYSDYENGYTGKYKLTIGYAVNDVREIPEGLTTVTIPAGKYKTFPSKSHAPQDVLAVWKTIWEIDSAVLKPNFIVTFEEYKDNQEVLVHIGYD
jgi:predicted transcriptional regulator YdeE